MNRTWLAAALFVAVFLGVMAYSTWSLAQNRVRVEVCMEFKGGTNCRTAAGSSREFALRAAVSNACAELTSGVTETMACDQARPASVRWLGKR